VGGVAVRPRRMVSCLLTMAEVEWDHERYFPSQGRVARARARDPSVEGPAPALPIRRPFSSRCSDEGYPLPRRPRVAARLSCCPRVATTLSHREDESAARRQSRSLCESLLIIANSFLPSLVTRSPPASLPTSTVSTPSPCKRRAGRSCAARGRRHRIRWHASSALDPG